VWEVTLIILDIVNFML